MNASTNDEHTRDLNTNNAHASEAGTSDLSTNLENPSPEGIDDASAPIEGTNVVATNGARDKGDAPRETARGAASGEEDPAAPKGLRRTTRRRSRGSTPSHPEAAGKADTGAVPPAHPEAAGKADTGAVLPPHPEAAEKPGTGAVLPTSGAGLRLRAKVWTDPSTARRYCVPIAIMSDPAYGVLTAYAITDADIRQIKLTAIEWNALPFAYFKEDGPAPRLSAPDTSTP